MTSTSGVSASYDIAVTKQILQGTREQGQQALSLIESARTAPPPVQATQGSVGRMIDVKA
jgi:hypothetical protein